MVFPQFMAEIKIYRNTSGAVTIETSFSKPYVYQELKLLL